MSSEILKDYLLSFNPQVGSDKIFHFFFILTTD